MKTRHFQSSSPISKEFISFQFHFVFIFFLMLLLSNNNGFAEKVDLSTAKNVAINLYNERVDNSVFNIGISSVIEEKENGETVFYVLRYSEKGFALIAAYNIVPPVIGYSFESDYDENDHSPAFRYFIIERYKKRIYAARNLKITPDNKTINDWNKYAVNPISFQPENVKSSVPLLTTMWGQGLYYNTLCPEDPENTTSGHVYVGCVATAMAQVLNYWQHPWHGTGSHSYTPEDHPEYGVQSADFANAIYNFDSMPNVATSYSEDLAELMYHCAVSVNMDFGPDGSGAWPWGNNDVRDALQNYFYFNENGNDLNRSSYPGTLWIDKMKENIDQHRPVIYGGYDNDTDKGHAWVLDAYTSGDMFHCNWGWSGADNGFYLIDDFSVAGNTFDDYQHASVTIHPKVSHVNGTWDLTDSPVKINYDCYVDPGDQLIIEPGVDVIFTGRYKLEVQGKLQANGTAMDSIRFWGEDYTVGMRGIRFSNTNNYPDDSSTINYCRFSGGRAFTNTVNEYTTEYFLGGAIYCNNSAAVSITNSRFLSNRADKGGAIYCGNSSDIFIGDCKIEYNNASSGAGICCDHSNPEIINSIIRLNTGYDVSSGGGLSCNNSSPVISDVIITENTVTKNGGGIYCYDNSDISLTNVEISNNTAEWGGGMECWWQCTPSLTNVTIIDNEAGDNGGGILIESANPIITNSVIRFNRALNGEGGGIWCGIDGNPYIYGTQIDKNGADYGGGIYCKETDYFEIEKSTLYYNTASIAGNHLFINNATITSKESIIWSYYETEHIHFEGSAVLDASYSDIRLPDGEICPGVGNINADPLFYSTTTNDYHLTWDNYPEPDSTKSPCIDSGYPFSPPDPDGTPADMGALSYEQTYTPLIAGNINGTLLCSESPYYIYGNLTVPSGDQLVIEPCVYMIFQGQYYLKVQGQLLAQGTESDKITFCAADSATGWSGIRFSGTSSNGQDSTKLENCRLFWGNVGDGGALYFEYSSDILVKDCHILKNRASDQGGGIHLFYAAPLLINNIIENNIGKYGGGIYAYVGNYQVHGGIILNNTAEIGGGIYQRGSSPQFHGVTVKNNFASRIGGGIYFYANCSPVFYSEDRCNFYDNYAVIAGTDFFGNFSAGAHPTIYVDTFTVISPDKHFIYPYDEFTVDILNGKTPQVAGDLYVSPTGDDANSGTSEAEPLQTIYQALKIILPDPVIERTIYLEPETYSNRATNENFPLNMRTDVTLDGGFRPLCILDGDSLTNFFYFYDDQNCELSSITFRNGAATYGGAIHIDHHSTPELDNVSFIRDSASNEGGAIFSSDYSHPIISHANFNYNHAEGNGGAMACKEGSSPSLEFCEFRYNTGYNGGGIYAKSNAHLSLTYVSFYNNSARKGGGCWIDYDSDPIFTNVAFFSNEATYGNGGGANFSYYSDPVMNNCLFKQNTASHGGGGFSIGSFGILEMNNGWIKQNIAGYGGGVIGGSNCTLTLRNVEISNNTAVSTPYSNDEGGGLYLSDVDVSLINVTISDNLTTTDGGAIYCRLGSNISIHNGILWNNIPDGINIESGTVTAEYSDIEGGWAGTGNLDVIPNFLSLPAYNYSLHELSPCIDMGTPDTTGLLLPETDLNGIPRIGNGRIDMGAYEYFDRTELDLSVFLEGPYNGTDMNTDLTDIYHISSQQPYNAPPWNYFGWEDVYTTPLIGVVDWVLIELRDAADAASATESTTFSRFAGLLLSDGAVVSADIIPANPIFYDVLNEQLFVVIWHRNHLGIMSSNPLTETGGIFSYDYTLGPGQAYNSGQKEIATGVWGMIAGDADANGIIELDDKSLFWSLEAGSTGYLNSDFNLDSQTNNKDKNDIWILNVVEESQVP